MIAGVQAAAKERAPFRCARAIGAPVALAHDVPIVIGVIADARGDDRALAALHAKLLALHAQLVFADGGMGTSQVELERTLGAIADPSWSTVAIAGARESVPDLRKAIASLDAKNVIDARAIDLGAVKIVTLPGETSASRLAAGADGCTRDARDIEAALAVFPGGAQVRSKPVPRILISATAPRSDGGDDLAPGGIHAGELDLAAALAKAPFELIVHPQIGAPTSSGKADHDNAAIAAGIAAAAPRYDDAGRALAPSGVVVTVDRSGIRWQAIEATAPP
ncbi:MAG TPA: hypothetical protein VL463_10640 [Kofleriaceae bacterium]|nr:hypothetical protein [Kofleriaceae bacterium]